MTTPSNPAKLRRFLLMVVVVGFLLRVSGMVITHSYRVRLDKDESANIAAAIATGQGFSNPFGIQTGPTAWLGPVYPFLLSRFFVAFGPNTTTAIVMALLFSCVMGSLTAIPVYFIALYTFGERLAERSAWVWAWFPYTIYWGMKGVWDTSFSTFLFTVLFMMTLQMAESSTLRKWAIYGLLFGIAGLTNTAQLSFLPLAGLWICYRQFRQGKPFLRDATVGAILFLAVLTPWTVRNYQVFHKFIPVRGNFGEEFHLGNTPDAMGNWQVFLHPTTNLLELRKYQRMGEVAYIHSKLEQTLQFVRDQPGRFAYLTFAHFVYYWASPPHAEKYPGIYELKTFLFLCSSVFAFWGLLIALRQRLAGAWLYVLLLLSYPTIYYITFPHPRYRHPIEPELLILVVFFASQIGATQTGKVVPAVQLRTEN